MSFFIEHPHVLSPGQGAIGRKHIVITAHCEARRDGDASLYFRAHLEGRISKSDFSVPEQYHGYLYRKTLAAYQTVHSYSLADSDVQDHRFATDLIKALAGGQLSGKTARQVYMTLFRALVIDNAQSTFITDIDDPVITALASKLANKDYSPGLHEQFKGGLYSARDKSYDSGDVAIYARGAGEKLHFTAWGVGRLINNDVPNYLSGADYRFDLRESADLSDYEPGPIEAILAQQLTDENLASLRAKEACWSLFYESVIKNPHCNFLDSVPGFDDIKMLKSKILRLEEVA